MLKVYFLFALLWALVFSSDICEEIELGNATAVCCEKNTTFRVGQVDVSFVPYRSHICPVVQMEGLEICVLDSCQVFQ